jgi:hypothetical protein
LLFGTSVQTQSVLDNWSTIIGQHNMISFG